MCLPGDMKSGRGGCCALVVQQDKASIHIFHSPTCTYFGKDTSRTKRYSTPGNYNNTASEHLYQNTPWQLQQQQQRQQIAKHSVDHLNSLRLNSSVDSAAVARGMRPRISGAAPRYSCFTPPSAMISARKRREKPKGE